MKGILMHTLFSLIEALTATPPNTVKELEHLIQAPIILSKENEYYQFWGIADPLNLNDGSQIGRIDFSIPRSGRKARALAFDYIEGNCISREDIITKFGYIGSPLPPNNPAPGAESIWRIELNSVQVGFGFRNDNPDCLSSVGMRFDSTP